MNRRQFLIPGSRDDGSLRRAELSCEKAYVMFVNAHSDYAKGFEEAGRDSNAAWWAGEPPLQLSDSDPELFFKDLTKELLQCDVVEIKDMDWLVDKEFRQRIDSVLLDFRASGGKVEILDCLVKANNGNIK